MSGPGQYHFTPGGGADQGGPGNPGTTNRTAATYNSNLEDLSSAIRKPLPLRQQTDKPTLRYSGIITNGSTGAPLMLTSHSRPPAVPLFSQSDIQYLRQQVQQYSTPPAAVLNNVLFTSFVNKAQQTPPTSMYTITNGPVSNINVNVQAPPAQPYSPLIGRNPYSRPISAQEIQPPDGLSSLSSLLMPSSSSSSNSSLVSAPTASIVLTPTATCTSPPGGMSGSPVSPGVQTNVFMKPQATHSTSSSAYKSEKRSTHSTINVKENKLGSVIYKPHSMTPLETCRTASPSERSAEVRAPSSASSGQQSVGTEHGPVRVIAGKPAHVTVNAVIKPNSSSIIVTVPRPPSGSRRSSVGSPHAVPTPVTRAHSNSVVAPMVTRAPSQVVKPETYSFVTNIPNHQGPKGATKQSASSPKDLSKTAEESRTCKDSLASSSKLMNNMIPKSSIPRPGTAARSRPGSSTHRKEDSPSEIRNLNYTPTKPYHEVNNNSVSSTDLAQAVGCEQRSLGKTSSTTSEPLEDPVCTNTDSPSRQSPSSRTLYYHKTSKTEVVLHRPPLPRPRTEGAPTAAQHTDPRVNVAAGKERTGAQGVSGKGCEATDEDEWEDEAEDSTPG